MLRIVISEDGGEPLPPLDLDDPTILIGSDPSARIRLPAAAAAAEHVQLDSAAKRYRILSAVRRVNEQTGGEGETRVVRRASTPSPANELQAGDEGDIGGGVTLAIGAYRVRVEVAPDGAHAAPPQRTESLARELMRKLMGGGAAPTLEIERGPAVGSKRALAAPGSKLVIGRGDEAGWILLDEDLSRMHAEIRRSWDGTRVVDLGSKNGTRLDGAAVTGDGAVLRDGALVELGKVALRFRDPAERQLAGAVTAPSRLASTSMPQVAAASTRAAAASSKPAASTRASASKPAATPTPSPVSGARRTKSAREAENSDEAIARPSAVPFYVAVTIMIAALVGLVWVLSL